jgi:hypothetical protein
MAYHRAAAMRTAASPFYPPPPPPPRNLVEYSPLKAGCDRRQNPSLPLPRCYVVAGIFLSTRWLLSPYLITRRIL